MPITLILAAVGAVSTTAILAALIIGIRRADRRHLARGPQSNSDAFARRLLLGVRYSAENSEKETSQ
jgi:hypothetical protein